MIIGFEIGTTAENRTSVQGQVDRRPSSCRFVRYPVQHYKANGQQYGDGSPVAYWRWKFLSQDDLNSLHEFMWDGTQYQPSATVYIKTRDDRGVFMPYSAIMHWPEDVDSKRDVPGVYRDVEFMFTELTE